MSARHPNPLGVRLAAPILSDLTTLAEGAARVVGRRPTGPERELGHALKSTSRTPAQADSAPSP